ncbi:hypothetical protein HYALB_00007086 [Hymenoscyphus albidus]|uniref:Uncharacterized protein n=1 Tax=Hymenoscyphus albidus TaxID=595503 RepID=A0A9N9LMT7_9HELO|nr:hypothetical protein HYALB_00007086 [Hymenoscyphus albidus]
MQCQWRRHRSQMRRAATVIALCQPFGSSDARRDMEMIAIWFHSELQDSGQMEFTRFSGIYPQAVVDVRGLKAMCRGTVPGKAVDNWEQPRFRVQTGGLADWQTGLGRSWAADKFLPDPKSTSFDNDHDL